MPNYNTILKENCDSIYDLSNKNLYAINFSPNDIRHFLHIGPLAESDNNSLVITVRKDVYDYFDKIDKPVILLNIYNPWRKIKDLKKKVPKVQYRKKLLLSLDIFTLILLLRAASLIDLLDIVTSENGLPQTLITLQDYHNFDSVFASYYKGKLPTITLQHGKATIQNKYHGNLWKYLISDWMIVLGSHQAEMLKYAGVDYKKIKVLGTAKYDKYYKNFNYIKKEKNKKRILISILPSLSESFTKSIINFLKILLKSKENYLLSIRFHPSVRKLYRRQFVQRLKKRDVSSNADLEISDVEDPLEDIANSEIILTSATMLAIEVILLRKPVIEYLSSKRNDNEKFRDYRDYVLYAPNGKDAEALIIKLLNDKNFYNKIVEKQNNFVNSEIIPPPAIPRILNFINSLNNNKRSVKNNQ